MWWRWRHTVVENNSTLFNKVNKAENISESTPKKYIVNTLLEMKKNRKTCYLTENGRGYKNPTMFEDSLFYEPLNSFLLENCFTSVLLVDRLLIPVQEIPSTFPNWSGVVSETTFLTSRHIFSVGLRSGTGRSLHETNPSGLEPRCRVCWGSMSCWNLNYRSIFALHGARWLEFIVWGSSENLFVSSVCKMFHYSSLWLSICFLANWNQ